MVTRKYDEMTIGEIVADDFRAATIFKNAGIDFCCGGNKSLDTACKEKGIEPLAVLNNLKELDLSKTDYSQNYKEWDLGFLSDYIVNTHHKYVIKSLPELEFYLSKIASVHGERHPELVEIAAMFMQVSNELKQHLHNEENVLFPAIKEVLRSGSEEAKARIVSEITRMSGEHEFAGGTLDKINEITHNYTVPSDGCNTYRVSFKMLQAFEDDLHVHVHLENNILFPKALSLSK